MKLMLFTNQEVLFVLLSPKERPNLKDWSPPRRPLFPVGRLDKESEGLLIITSDSQLANKLTHLVSNTKKSI